MITFNTKSILQFFTMLLMILLTISTANGQPNVTVNETKEEKGQAVSNNPIVISKEAFELLTHRMETQLKDVQDDIDELKEKKISPYWNILMPLIGVVVGGWIAAFTGSKRAEKDRKSAEERAKEDRASEYQKVMDESTRNIRMEKYACIFKDFEPYGRWLVREEKVQKSSITSIVSSLTTWYYQKAGGLVMSTICKKVFFTARGLLKKIDDELKNSDNQYLDLEQYAAVYYCCSTLRTALIYDVDGKRELGLNGEESLKETKDKLKSFVGLLNTLKKDFIKTLSEKQKENDKEIGETA